MENIDIYDHATLLIRIRQLRADKKIQEEELKCRFSEFVDTLNPLAIVKGSLHDLASDKEIQFDLAKVALNMGSNLIIDQVFGKYRSIKGFFSSVLVENISNGFINSGAIKILSLFKKKKTVKEFHTSESQNLI